MDEEGDSEMLDKIMYLLDDFALLDMLYGRKEDYKEFKNKLFKIVEGI